MARSAFQAYITNPDDGGVLDGAQLTVAYEAGGTATIYEQQVGGAEKDNPFTIGTDGKAVFYAEPGLYRITATQGGITSEFRNYRIGVFSNELNDITSIASLNTAALVDGQHFNMTGWRTGSDLGGGSLYYDSTRPQTDHDGGTVFALGATPPTDFNDPAQIESYLNAGSGLSGNGCLVRSNVQDVALYDFGAEAGFDISPVLLAVANSGYRVVEYSGKTYTHSSTIAVGVDLDLSGDFTIQGFDGTGIVFSGDRLSLNGISVVDFGDGTEDQSDNYATSFVLIQENAVVESINVEGVISSGCRSVVAAKSTTSDTTTFPSTVVECLTIKNCVVDTGVLPFYFRCTVSRQKIKGNEFRNIHGSGNKVMAYCAYIDGQGFDDPSYQNIGDADITGNLFHTIVNRTTTGDSSPGNSFEVHAVMVSGVRVNIHHNIFIDVTGAPADCEAIYTKAEYTQVSNNILVDAGVAEGAINIKGLPSDYTGTDTSPVSERNIVSNNVIAFTRYQYDNAGTLVDLEPVGLHISGSTLSRVSDNTFVGCFQDTVVDGFQGSKNRGFSFENNLCVDTQGASSLSLRGAFDTVSILGNRFLYPGLDPTRTGSNFRFIYCSQPTDRGVNNRLWSVNGNQFVADNSDGRFDSRTLSLAVFDVGVYPYEAIHVENNQSSVKIGGAGSQLVRISPAASGSEVVNNLIVRGNRDAEDSIGFVYMASGEINNYEIEQTIRGTIGATTETFSRLRIYNGASLHIDATINSQGPNPGEAHYEQIKALYYDNAGAATQIGADTSVIDNSSLAAGGAFVSSSSSDVQVRVTGPVKTSVKVRAVMVSP